MQILDKISHSHPIYFKPLQSGKRSPSIEITFVFDELDKLATDISTQLEKGNPDGNDNELHRLNLMKGLLSNMKRIITSSEARFIFLGGRLLHDDWLADGARRQPLLSSIFNDEIYLSSLLTDHGISQYQHDKPCFDKIGNIAVKMEDTLNNRIEEYFVWQFYLARIRFSDWANRIWAPVIGLRELDARQRGFIQIYYNDLKDQLLKTVDFLPDDITKPLHTLAIRYTDNGKHLDEGNFEREQSRLEAFVDFLAYRSAGNPKKLNELLASFVVSSDRAIDTKVARDDGFMCQDVLYLPDHKVMRIQLIARVYKQLRKSFETKIRGRDDKTIVSLIYLCDFLFKFHQRAFSWENLELIDELIHMHRGHDMRVLLQELVEGFGDRYLHRIINGMYSYRFRSYFSNELEYLSRHSEEEMAAFNFTLDEAQALRDHLERQLGDGDDLDKVDFLGMLGELHEFYQEYEKARQYYRRCIIARQNSFKNLLGEKIGNNSDEMTVLRAIYTATNAGSDALLAIQHWCPSTLRLFLKIIMTYEREHNDTEALIRCERCMTFAESILKSFLSLKPEQLSPQNWNPVKINKGELAEHAYKLEYLGLLFEPMFAHAWLLEKNPYTSSNSYEVLNKNISKLLQLLSNDSDFSLLFVQAQWFKKMGALCFYKGLARTKSLDNTEKPRFIQDANKHYRFSAICLSYYFSFHVRNAPNTEDFLSIEAALYSKLFPADHCLCIAECLGDLSESILAGIEPKKLFVTSKTAKKQRFQTYENELVELIKYTDKWFYNRGEIDKNIESLLSQKQEFNKYSCLLSLLSQNFYNGSEFESSNTLDKFDLALNLALLSAFYQLRAGNTESAAREAMHAVEVIVQYLNWYWADFIISSTFGDHQQQLPLIILIFIKIKWYFGFIEKLFNSVRLKPKRKYKMGDLIPSSALTSCCSIGIYVLYFLHYEKNAARKSYLLAKLTELKKIIEEWAPISNAQKIESTKPTTCVIENWHDYFIYKIIFSLRRHRYPVLNQLNAIKTLVDGSLMRFYSQGTALNDNVAVWLEELYYINEKYSHPMHFTPMQIGSSFYLYLSVNNFELPEQSEFDFNLRGETRRFLIQSLDMCHMGKGYYEAIGKMYYLYDDFNDNQIHRNHAMQIAGAELTKKMLIELEQHASN
ncbi:hypothetical protein [Methylomonas sp. CM2]|uniref:hypothetical protein n=1 Tax=Methylomonas sp. CM2 TaxID=3417647 RepID=UPI003CF60286